MSKVSLLMVAVLLMLAMFAESNTESNMLQNIQENSSVDTILTATNIKSTDARKSLRTRRLSTKDMEKSKNSKDKKEKKSKPEEQKYCPTYCPTQCPTQKPAPAPTQCPTDKPATAPTQCLTL
jgi:hypothetical protein